MKKKLAVLALCVVLISGCGKKIPTLSNGDEAVVTLKDGKMISANDLYTKVKDEMALQALISMIDKNILEDKYGDKIDEANEYAESMIAQLESYYGDDLLNAIQYYTEYNTIEAYKESTYIGYLQNLAVEDYAKAQLKDKEIKKYYDNEIVGDIKINHILVVPEVTDDMTDDEKTKAEEDAKNEINSIIEELKSSKDVNATFEKLAKEHSDDDSTKDSGGSLGYINKGTLGDSYAELEEAAFKLKDGEYSTSIITTENGYHVILRVDTKKKAPLDEIEDSIRETLSKDYITDNPECNITALQELRKDYNLEIIDSELSSQYAKYIQNALAKYRDDSSSSSSSNKKS